MLFNQKQIRRHWDEDKELWYFSIVDAIGVLNDSTNPNNYWKVLKNKKEMSRLQIVTN